MKRSPVGLLIVAVLFGMMLYWSGVWTWHATPWETHAAKTVQQTVRKAAKSIGIRVHVPPKPPGVSPAPTQNTPNTTQTPSPATPKATTESTAQTQSLATLYPTGSGQAIPAPTTSQAVTSAFCALEHVSAATCQQAVAQAQ